MTDINLELLDGASRAGLAFARRAEAAAGVVDRALADIDAAGAAQISAVEEAGATQIASAAEQAETAATQAGIATTQAELAGAASRAEAIKAAYRKDPTANLFDASKVTGSKSINSGNGAATNQNVNYSITDFIPVIPGFTLSTMNALGYNGQGGAFYTDPTETSFIAGSGFTSVAAGGTLTIPSTGNFMRATIQTVSGSTLRGKTHIVHGPAAPTVYRSFDTPDTVSARKLISTVMAERRDPQGNLYDSSKALDNQQVAADGTFSSASGYFAFVIGVNAGENLYFTHGDTSGNSRLVFSNADGSTNTTTTTFAAQTAIPVPEGAVSLRGCLNKNAAVDPVYGLSRPINSLGIYLNAIPATLTSGKQSDAQQLASAAVRAAMPRRVNLFIKKDVSPNTLLNSSNTMVTDSNYQTTDYFQVNDALPLYTNVTSAGGGGNQNYGYCFYDSDKNFLFCNAGTCAVNVSSGSFNIVVTSLSASKRLLVGSAIQCAGIPTGSWIATAPTGGGTGTYTFANSTATPASANATGASLSWGGALPLVPLTLHKGVGIAQARIAFSASGNNPADIKIWNDANASPYGLIGWDDVLATLPFLGKNIGISGDSKAKDGTGGNLFQLGIANALHANATIQGAIGGARIAEMLDSLQSDGLDNPSVRTPWTSASVQTLALVCAYNGHNNFGVHISTASTADAESIFPHIYCSIPGNIGDTWIPTNFTAHVEYGSRDITGPINFTRGSFQDGMPLYGEGLPIDCHLVNESGTWRLSSAAIDSVGAASIVGGTICGDLHDVWIRKLRTWNPYLILAQSTPGKRFDDILSNGHQTGPTPGNPRNGRGLLLSDIADTIRNWCYENDVICIDMYREGGIGPGNYTIFLDGGGLHENRLGQLARTVPSYAGMLNNIRFGYYG